MHGLSALVWGCALALASSRAPGAAAVKDGVQSGGDDMAAAPEADTPANLDLDTRVCQGTKCTIILACLSILVVLALLAVGYSLYTCYKKRVGQEQMAAQPASAPVAMMSSRRARRQLTRQQRQLARGDPVEAAVEMAKFMRPPPLELLGKPVECPVCFEETECDAGSWRVFPCQHGVCAKCFDGIVKAHARESACPLCRDRVLKPAEGESAVAAEEGRPAEEPPPTVEGLFFNPWWLPSRPGPLRRAHQQPASGQSQHSPTAALPPAPPIAQARDEVPANMTPRMP